MRAQSTRRFRLIQELDKLRHEQAWQNRDTEIRNWRFRSRIAHAHQLEQKGPCSHDADVRY